MSKDSTAEYIGKNIAKLRKMTGMTQEALAKKTGLQSTSVSSIEAGNRNITVDTAQRIALALRVPLEQLFAAQKEVVPEGVMLPTRVLFLKLGGTWDMEVTKEGLMGDGGFNDKALEDLEVASKFNEKRLVTKLDALFDKTKPIEKTFGEHLPWVKDLDSLIAGEFVPLFSGDSSHYRPAIMASVLAYIFKRIHEEPLTQVIAGMGTDTVDILLLFLDVFLFDKTGIPAVLFSGANRSHQEKKSDAPQNFHDLAFATHLPLLPGAYYVFNQTLYKGGDFVKVDPNEDPSNLEGQITFFSPHRTQMKLGFLGAGTTRRESNIEPAVTMPAHDSSALFDAMNDVVTINLGDSNDIEDEIAKINDAQYRGIIIVSHAPGNVPFPIRRAAVEAAKKGKLVMNISRCVTSETSKRYFVSLSSANQRELKGTKKQIIDGGLLSNRAAKAILTRALIEDLDQRRTQELVYAYIARTF